MKQIKEAASAFGFGSSQKPNKSRSEKSIFEVDSDSWDSHESGSASDKAKIKSFKTLFYRGQREGHGGGIGNDHVAGSEEKASKSAKKQWGFDGFKKWKRGDSEDETAPLPLHEKSDSEAFMGSCQLVAATPIAEGPNTREIKRKLHANGAPSDFFIDKVLGDKIKKELSRIQTELSTTNPNVNFSNDQIEAISTTLPADKADPKKFFPKTWCDRYGDVLLDVVKKEFKDHVAEIENVRNATREKHMNNSMQWTTFEDDENCHPNLFADSHTKEDSRSNPFSHDYSDNKLRPESAFFQNQNPFWSPRLG